MSDKLTNYTGASFIPCDKLHSLPKMGERKAGTATVHQYDSLEKFLGKLPENPPNWADSSTKQGEEDFYGCGDYATGWAWLKTGNAEHTATVASFTQRLADKLGSPCETNLAPAYVGPYIDVGRYADGDPECFRVLDDRQPKREPVNILVNICVSCNVRARNLALKSAAVAALVKLLDDRGIQANVWTVMSCEHDGTYKALAVRVKTAGQQLDLDRLAYVVGHPAFFRRIVFRWIEYEMPKAANWNYGSPKQLAPEDSTKLLPNGETWDLDLQAESQTVNAFTDEEQVEKWVISKLNKLAPAQAPE